MFFPLMVMPQLILSIYIARNMYPVPQSLIEASMFDPKELKSGLVSKDMVFQIIITITLVSFGGGFIYAFLYAKRKVHFTDSKNAENQPSETQIYSS